MLNGRLQRASIRQSGSWLRSRSGRLLTSLGVSAVLPQVAGAARKDRPREDDQGQKGDDSTRNRNDSAGGDASDGDKNAEPKAESRDPGENKDRSNESEQDGKRDRNESRNTEEQSSARAESDEDESRREAKRQDSTAESDKSSRNDDDNAGAGRQSREFEQVVDEEPAEDVPATTTTAPTNPNVVITDVPEVSDVDLVVEANPDVIASVSASGGFAFARSGGVTAVTGPDGASIIQTGEDGTATSDPGEPSDDGGNNDLDFSS